MFSDEDDDYCSNVSFAPWGDDGYDLFREHAEQAPTVSMEDPLDTAMRTNNVPLRCYYEEHGKMAAHLLFPQLSASARAKYNRLPIVSDSGLASGAFFVRSCGGEVREISPEDARKDPMHAFQAI